MSITERDILDRGADLSDREDAEAAVTTAFHSCSHIQPLLFVEAMTEMIGVLVKEGAISYQDVHTRLDAAMPAHLQQGPALGESSAESWGDNV